MVPITDQFQTTEKSIPQISGNCLSRFHPTEPVLACGSTGSSSVILLKGANGSIPFANWKIEQEFKRQTQEEIYLLEWNVSQTVMTLIQDRVVYVLHDFLKSLTKSKVNGTQLAAGCADGTVIVWSYPSGDVLFEEKKHSDKVKLITWNPFRQDVFATSVYGVMSHGTIRHFFLSFPSDTPLTCPFETSHIITSSLLTQSNTIDVFSLI